MRPAEGYAFQIFPVGVDHVNMALPIDGRAEGQMPTVGRPGWGIIDARSGRHLHSLLPVR